jgi:pimeloyl-ACP methyl ester carboxylesterase
MFTRSTLPLVLMTLTCLLVLLSQLPLLITTFWPLSDQGKVQTQLYLPASARASNPAPLLVVFGGSEGGMSMTDGRREQQRQQYLDAGYALLVVGYFALPGTPAGLDRIELTSIVETIQNTAKNPLLNPEKLAVLGVSKGAELALLLASRMPQISTVISVVGSDAVFASPEWYSTSSSWAWQQQPVTFVPLSLKAAVAMMQGDYRRGYELAMHNDDWYQQAKIPVEQMQADVLFISGTADELWPSSEMADRMMARLQQHHYAFRSKHLKIQGAGHGGLTSSYQAQIIEFLKHQS